MIVIAVWIPQLSFLVGVLLLWVAVVDELVVTLGRAGRRAACGACGDRRRSHGTLI